MNVEVTDSDLIVLVITHSGHGTVQPRIIDLNKMQSEQSSESSFRVDVLNGRWFLRNEKFLIGSSCGSRCEGAAIRGVYNRHNNMDLLMLVFEAIQKSREVEERARSREVEIDGRKMYRLW